MLYGSSLSRIRLLGHIVEYLKQWTPNETGVALRHTQRHALGRKPGGERKL